jgi:hypothetical protein
MELGSKQDTCDENETDNGSRFGQLHEFLSGLLQILTPRKEPFLGSGSSGRTLL